MSILNFFKFIKEPFPESKHPDYIFAPRNYKRIVKNINVKLREKSGVSFLVGKEGMGKTFFIDLIGKQVSINDIFIKITAKKKNYDVFEDIAGLLNLKKGSADIIAGKLVEYQNKGKNVVLAIDDADNLSVEQIKKVENLFEINSNLRILFSVKSYIKFDKWLSENNIIFLNKTPSAIIRLSRFTYQDTKNFIKSLVKDAKIKVTNNTHFTKPAMYLIAFLSSGRVKNIYELCGLSLKEAYNEQTKIINIFHVLKSLKKSKLTPIKKVMKKTGIIIGAIFVGVLVLYFSVLYSNYLYKQKTLKVRQELEQNLSIKDVLEQERKKINQDPASGENKSNSSDEENSPKKPVANQNQ